MNGKLEQWFWALLRLVLGFEFLWAFLDKTFGLGFAVKPSASWLNGGSPTTGFLKFGVKGPFAGFFHSLAGIGIVDWIFMAAMLGIGLALILGVFVRLASLGGALFMAILWFALLWPANNPILDEHLIELVAFFGLMVTTQKPGNFLGLGKWWQSRAFVQKCHWLE